MLYEGPPNQLSQFLTNNGIKVINIREFFTNIMANAISGD